MRARRAAVFAGAMLLVALPVAAHHQLEGEFDQKQPVTLKGTVTKIDWNNPHVHLYIDARDNRSEIMRWELQMGSPNTLLRNGWKRDTLRPGDHVTVNAYPAKDGSNFGYASKVTITSQ